MNNSLEDLAIRKLRDEVKLQCEFAIMGHQDIEQTWQALFNNMQASKQANDDFLRARKELHETYQMHLDDPQKRDDYYRERRRALESVNQVTEPLQKNIQPQKKRLFYAVQSFLVAVANVGKLFWPTRPQEETPRREKLRKALLIENDMNKHDFGKNVRKVRNSFEHFDARIDGEWFNSTGSHNMADLNIMPLSMIEGIKPTNCFRNFDPNDFSITFYDDKIELSSSSPLMVSLQELLRNIEEIERQELTDIHPNITASN